VISVLSKWIDCCRSEVWLLS